MSDELKREIWANAVLKDGKLLFWLTASEKKEMRDFYEGSPNGDLRMKEALQSGRYELVNRKVEKVEDAEEFYKQYEMYDPYTNSKTMLPEGFYD